MATYESKKVLSFIAAADLSAKQYYAVRESAQGYVNVGNAIGCKCLGLLQDAPASGAPAQVAIGGRAIGIAAGTITYGDPVESTATGLLQKSNGNGWLVGIALESGTAGAQISVLVISPVWYENRAYGFTAGADLSAKAKYACKVGLADNAVVLATAGSRNVGIIEVGALAAATCYVKTCGVAVGTSGAAVTLGASVCSDANGKVVDDPGTPGTHRMGIALSDTAGANEDVYVLLTGPEIVAPVVGVASGYKLARGRHTTIAAEDTVVSGLATVVAVVLTEQSNPAVDPLFFSADIGNQAGAPAAGSFYLRSWQPTAVNNVTPIAATTFAKVVNWIAVGT